MVKQERHLSKARNLLAVGVVAVSAAACGTETPSSSAMQQAFMANEPCANGIVMTQEQEQGLDGSVKGTGDILKTNLGGGYYYCRDINAVSWTGYYFFESKDRSWISFIPEMPYLTVGIDNGRALYLDVHGNYVGEFNPYVSIVGLSRRDTYDGIINLKASYVEKYQKDITLWKDGQGPVVPIGVDGRMSTAEEPISIDVDQRLAPGYPFTVVVDLGKNQSSLINVIPEDQNGGFTYSKSNDITGYGWKVVNSTAPKMSSQEQQLRNLSYYLNNPLKGVNEGEYLGNLKVGTKLGDVTGKVAQLIYPSTHPNSGFDPKIDMSLMQADLESGAGPNSYIFIIPNATVNDYPQNK